jgi:hypothetical protein
MGMVSTESDPGNRLEEWLRRLGGSYDPNCFRENRDRAIQEMRAVGAERLFPLLVPLLAHSDLEVRCKACEAILWIDPGQGIDLVLPLLEDNESTVRWNTCGLLHDFGDERAVDSLVTRMKEDPDPQVRGTAAYALGGIGCVKAIPALIATLDADHECDQLGYPPSSCAASALDDILGTSETRIKVSDSICKLRSGEPDLDKLKETAFSVHRRWVESESV